MLIHYSSKRKTHFHIKCERIFFFAERIVACNRRCRRFYRLAVHPVSPAPTVPPLAPQQLIDRIIIPVAFTALASPITANDTRQEATLIRMADVYILGTYLWKTTTVLLILLFLNIC